MNLSKRFISHLNTVNKHRFLVTKLCFKCGMYKQGLLHDLSKYSFIEFFSGVKYYQGFQSPITKEKSILGYSKGWLHHKGRNKHHWEYWVDRLNNDTYLTCIQMPFNYVLEMVLDKISASKTYNGKKWNQHMVINHFRNSYEYNCMNSHTCKQVDHLLEYLDINGIEKALIYYKSLYKQYKKDNKFDII